MIRTASPQEIIWDGFAQSGHVHSGFHARDVQPEAQLFPDNCQFRASIKRMVTEEDVCESTKIRRNLSMVDVKDVRQALDVMSLGAPQKKRRTFNEGMLATSTPGCPESAEIVDVECEFSDGLRRKRSSDLERGSTLLDNKAFAEKVSSCAKVELLRSHVDQCKSAFLPEHPKATSHECTALILYQPKEYVVTEGLRRAARRCSRGGYCNGCTALDCLCSQARAWTSEDESMGAEGCVGGGVGAMETAMEDGPAQSQSGAGMVYGSGYGGSTYSMAHLEQQQQPPHLAHVARQAEHPCLLPFGNEMEADMDTGMDLHPSAHAPRAVYDGEPWQLPASFPQPPRPPSAPSPASVRPPPLAAHANADFSPCISPSIPPPIPSSQGLWPTPQLNRALWPSQELPAGWPNGSQAGL